jgi:hypothetical protein
MFIIKLYYIKENLTSLVCRMTSTSWKQGPTLNQLTHAQSVELHLNVCHSREDFHLRHGTYNTVLSDEQSATLYLPLMKEQEQEKGHSSCSSPQIRANPDCLAPSRNLREEGAGSSNRRLREEEQRHRAASSSKADASVTSSVVAWCRIRERELPSERRRVAGCADHRAPPLAAMRRKTQRADRRLRLHRYPGGAEGGTPTARVRVGQRQRRRRTWVGDLVGTGLGGGVGKPEAER